MTKSSCCHETPPVASGQKKHWKPDWLLLSTLAIVAPAYVFAWFEQGDPASRLHVFVHSIHSFMNTMAWGLLLGMAFIGVLSLIPREFVMSILGAGNGVRGVVRATMAGVLLDLCSHGILMVGAKLYERGATLGQVIAFLVASPWNSLSLTLILWALVGFKWMAAFLLLSMVLGVVSGVIFDRLVTRGVLPANPNRHALPDGFRFWPEAKKKIAQTRFDRALLARILRHSILDSRMVLRWIFLGVILAALGRTFMTNEMFQAYFGATATGLLLTLVAATVIEVCSEGSTPIGADLLLRAKAPGNAFAFLMAGVSTDYTEIMVLREVTKSWKVALFLPLVTLPQIIAVAIVLNQFGG